MAVLERLVVVVDAELGAFNRAMKGANRRVAKFGEDMNRMGQKLTLGLTVPLGAIGGASVVAATQMDSLRRGLTAVTGSSEEAARQLKRLEDVAKLPGLGFREAVQGATNLQAAGLSAELAEAALRGFGNALASVGKGRAELDGVITALTQIQAKGKVTAEEINQIAERLPQIRPLMQAAFGTSNTEELQKMGLSATAFIEGITVELNKLPKVAGGVGTSFEELADETFRASAKMGEALLPVVLPIVKALTDLATTFREMSPAMQTVTLGVAALAAAAGPLLSIIGLLTKGVIAFKAATTALGIAGGPLLLAVAAFGALAAAGIALVKNWGVISYEVKRMVDIIREQLVGRFNAIVESLRGKVEVVKGFFKDLYDKVVANSYVPDMIDGIKEQFARLDAVMVNPARNAARKVVDVFKQASAFLPEWALDPNALPPLEEAKKTPGILETAKGVLSGDAGIGDLFKSVGASFGHLLKVVGPLAIIFEVVQAALKPLQPVIEALREPLQIVGTMLGKILVPVLELLIPPMKLLAKVATYVVQGLGWLIEAIANVVNKLIPFGDPLKNLAKFGQKMQDEAEAARKALDDAAAGAEYLGKTLDKVASSLYNVPLISNAALARMRIGLGLSTTPNTAAVAPGASGLRVEGDVHIHAAYGDSPLDLWNRFQQGVQQAAAGGDPFARGMVLVPGSG